MAELRRERQKAKMEVNVTLHSVMTLGIVFAAGFLIGRVRISDGIWPFGVAYVLAAFLHADRINPYMALGGVLAALATYISQMDNIAFNFAVVGIAAALMIVASCLKLPMRPLTAIIAAGIAYLIGTLAFKLSLLLAALSSLVEMGLCMLMVLVLHNAFRFFAESRQRRVLSDEEIISLLFVAILGVLGLGDIHVFGVYLRNIVAVYLCLMAGFLGGASVGAGVGLALGLACVISGADTLYMANLGICSLVGGVCKKLKRPGTAIGFLATNLFMTFYAAESATLILPIIDALLGTAGFLFTPKSVLEFIGKYVDVNLLRVHEQKLHLERFRELTTGRLKEISRVFANASRIFADSASKNKETGSISYMIGTIPEKCCASCMFCRSCWDEDLEKTYALMQRLYEKYDKNGNIYERDLGQAFQKKCIYPERLIKAARSVFEKYRTNSKWESKIVESRAMVGEQLNGVSRVIDSLLKEVQIDLEFRPDLEEEIRIGLDGAGISAKEVCAYICGGNIQVNLLLKNCHGQELCRTRVQRVISEACGVPMQMQDLGPCTGRKYCRLRYEQAKAYSLQSGISRMKKEGSKVSGDAYSFEGLRDGRFMLLLCDGMGSGERAAQESSAAVSLMEDFYKANFDDKTVLDAINKLLLLSSSDEIFSTMDLCMINLIDGNAKFTKIGAPHSYLIRGNTIKKLQAGTLPIGILDEFRPAVYNMKVENGDLIIMFSDGIADLENASDTLFETILEAAKLRSTQEIADRILSMALGIDGGEAKDDMTVMVTRVVKNRSFAA